MRARVDPFYPNQRRFFLVLCFRMSQSGPLHHHPLVTNVTSGIEASCGPLTH